MALTLGVTATDGARFLPFRYRGLQCPPGGRAKPHPPTPNPDTTEPCNPHPRERERERVLHLSSRTGLMQVLPGHPLADPIREQSLCR